MELAGKIGLMPARFWSLAFIEFFRLVQGFDWREELKWKRTYELWRVQLKEPGSVTFDQFMGRPKKPSDMTEEEILSAWEEVVG